MLYCNKVKVKLIQYKSIKLKQIFQIKKSAEKNISAGFY